MDIIRKEIDGYKLALYKGKKRGPVIYNNTYEDNGKEIIHFLKKKGIHIHLLSISNMDWERALSPWPWESPDEDQEPFAGKANEYISWIQKNLHPFVEKELGDQALERCITGCSMAGLFALYTAYQIPEFQGIGSISGSFWYPDFLDYCLNHSFPKKPDAIYLSIGKKESQVKNPRIQQSDDIIKALASHYRDQDISTHLQWNEGKHFTEVDLRMSKAIASLVERLGKMRETS